MGACPPRYLLGRAARYWGVPPWELARQPAVWLHEALAWEWAENSAADARARRERER